METSRRAVLGAAVGGMALLGAAGLSACTSEAASTSPLGRARRGGHFIHGIAGGGATDTLSAFGFYTVPDYGRWVAQYDALFYTDNKYRVKKRLAEEYSSNSTADQWTIRVRPDVEFHNGKTMTADDVLFSLQQTMNPSVASFAAGFVSMIDIANTVKIDSRTVRIALTRGAVDFPEFLNAVAMVPTDYSESKPVGAGPFKVSHFQPGVRTDFVRHPNYWQPGKPHLDELSIIGFTDETARINALLSGQITGADAVDFSLAKLLNGKQGLAVLQQHTNNFIPFSMRVDQKPFDDVRVRQAFRLIADRPALNAGAFDGHGQVANDLYGRSDPFFASHLPQRVQDLDKARYLLKKAGADDLKLTLTTTDLGAGMTSMSYLFAAEAKKAGVHIAVDKLDSTTFTGPALGTYKFSPYLIAVGNYFYCAQQLDAPVSTTNFSHFADHEFDSLYYSASSETDPEKRKGMVQRMQEIEYERGSLLIAGFYDVFDGHSTKLGGLLPNVSGNALYQYADLWMD